MITMNIANFRDKQLICMFLSKCISKVKRVLNRLHTDLNKFLNEKQFHYSEVRIKYMFFASKKADTLIISFPACAPNAARYNYMRTLLPFTCDKLFLLDDFGDNHQGCYLVEERVEECCKQLINNVVNQQGGINVLF